MSANRDKDKKIQFVHSNLRVLKAEDVKSNHLAGIRVGSYSPTEMIGKRIEKPASLPIAPSAAPVAAPKATAKAPVPAIEDLKQNLKTLNDLQARLRFMLKELEEIVGQSEE